MLLLLLGYEGKDGWSCKELRNATWAWWRIEVMIFLTEIATW